MHFLIYYVIPFILVLSILIFFHELGHFLVAKYFRVRVLKFSLGFGPKLAGKKIGETEYLLSALPLGGYVKMLGEDETDRETPMSPEDEEASFHNKHVLKRIAIVGAGPVFNILLAFIVFAGFYMTAGSGVLLPEIGQVTEGSPASRAGFLKEDLIVSVNGAPVHAWDDVKDAVENSGGRALQMRVKRGDGHVTLRVVPEMSTVKNLFGEEIKTPLVGIVASGAFEKIVMGPLDATKMAFLETGRIIKLTFLTIVKLVQRIVPIKTLGGPLLIGQMTGELAQQDFSYLFPFIAVISINLGILNLLPVPILDGGFIIFLLIELITGKPLSIRKRAMAQKVGLFLLMMLMAVVIYNDVTRLVE